MKNLLGFELIFDHLPKSQKGAIFLFNNSPSHRFYVLKEHFRVILCKVKLKKIRKDSMSGGGKRTR